MTRRGERKAKERKKLLEQGYKECASCENLSTPGAFRCSSCGTLLARAKMMMAVAIVLVVILSSTLYYLNSGGHIGFEPLPPTIIGRTPMGDNISLTTTIQIQFDKDMNHTSTQSAFSLSPAVQGTFSWSGRTMTFKPAIGLQYGTTYTATVKVTATDQSGLALDAAHSWQFTTAGEPVERRGVGLGDTDFWDVYPEQHFDTGGAVDHPSWARSDASSKVTLILTHSEGCAPCITQMGICESICSDYSGQIIYHDLLSGTDEPEASETFAAYDPTGETNYIPLTILLTQGPDNEVIWHSWEGVVDELVLRSWVEDALSYHGDF